MDSGLPRNHTCINISPLTVGGNVNLSTQCPIDHIRSGTKRRNNIDLSNEDEYLYDSVDSNSSENNTSNNNRDLYLLEEEEIYDPSKGNIRS